MGSITEIMQLCRLCLVKDQVNVPIFDEQGVVKQILPKITACLPVKITKDDSLPKKICDGCSYKLDICYQFHNTSVKAEKQLQTWLTELAAKEKEQQEQPKIVLKQETIEIPADIETTEDAISTDAQSYILQQQQLPYPNIEFIDQSDYDGGDQPVVSTSEADVAEESVEPPTKRQRRAAAQKAIATIVETESDEENVDDVLEGKVAKLENDSDNDEDVQPPTFVGVPADADQPGPSGVGKSTETPSEEQMPCAGHSYICTLCNKSFPDAYKRRLHRKAYHTEKTIPCSMCDKKFKTNSQRKSHELCHTTVENKFECTLCGTKCKTLNSLRMHTKVRHVTTNYSFNCSYCGAGFHYQSAYKVHMERHANVRYICSVCSGVFRTAANLRNHKKRHDPNYAIPALKCDECGKSFQSDKGIRRHILVVHRGALHICEICGKTVGSAQSLRDHTMIHRGEKPFECDVCGKCFNKKKLLVTHFRIHTKERPYKCDRCEKAFSQRGSLTVHIRSLHTLEKPFVCNICEKSFVTKTVLKSHLTMTHCSIKV